MMSTSEIDGKFVCLFVFLLLINFFFLDEDVVRIRH